MLSLIPRNRLFVILVDSGCLSEAMVWTCHCKSDASFLISEPQSLHVVEIPGRIDALITLNDSLRIKTVRFNVLHMSPSNQNITLFSFLIRCIKSIWVHAQILYATTERHWPSSVLVYCERFGGRHGVLSYRLCIQSATSLCLEAKRILLHLHAHLVRTLHQDILYQLDNFHTIKVTLQFGNRSFFCNLPIWAVFAFRSDSLGFIIILPLRIQI